MPALIEPLEIIFNKSLSEGVLPTKMRDVDIVALHKYRSKTDKNNYRPISLLLTNSKILEKLVPKGPIPFFKNIHCCIPVNMALGPNTRVNML